MTQYQSFPGVKGASESLAKLKSLRLPSLRGKRFLDVGCNEGFFCGYARFDGASEVIGIDKSKAAVERARSRFPDCQFFAQSWEQLPEGKFDVILLASALHYADDQTALIHRLMDRLTDDGTLVLEIGLAPSGKSEWVLVKRSIDERLFPSRGKLAEILEDYAWKIIGHSVQQPGDPLTRYTVHVRRPKPFVFLLLEPPGSGKTTLCRTLFAAAKVPVVSGDLTYRQLSDGRIPASDALAATIRADFSPHYDRVAEKVLAQGLAKDLVDVWCDRGGGGAFAVDSYVPEKYQDQIQDAFLVRGYVPVKLDWQMARSMSTPGDAERKAHGYLESLRACRAESPAPTLQVTRFRSPALHRVLSGWHLDQPVNGQLLAADEQFAVSGWGLVRAPGVTELQCYVRTAGTTSVFKLDRPRQDVLQANFADPVDVPEGVLHCGFRFVRRREELLTGIEFGFVADGEEIPAAHLGVAVAERDDESLGRRLVSKVGARLWRRR